MAKRSKAAAETPKKKIFVIIHFSKEGSKFRELADNFVEKIVKTCVRDHDLNYEVDWGGKIRVSSEPGSLPNQLLRDIVEADIVVASLSDTAKGPSGNVYYELGWRHAYRKPYVLCAEEGTKRLFYVNQQNIIAYDLSDVEKLVQTRRELGQHLKIIEQRQRDNDQFDEFHMPYLALRATALPGNLPREENPPGKYVLGAGEIRGLVWDCVAKGMSYEDTYRHIERQGIVSVTRPQIKEWYEIDVKRRR
jgi:hypothetical protein